MWPPQVVPMSQPGSSAGHMPPGASGGAAPYPGPMNPNQHPGMGGNGGYPGGQMPLPYGQMEGNHAMYDHRMMANRAAAAAAAAGRPPPQGMIPDYTQMPMGQNPPNGMMRMPPQYPPGHPQMPGNPQMQYGQMMRAPPVSVYGHMNHAQQYAVTAHPNPAQPPFVLPEVRTLYETTYGYMIERELFSEGYIQMGSTGAEANIGPETIGYLEQNQNCEALLSVWQSVKGNDSDVRFEVYVNGQVIMNHTSAVKTVGIKHLLRSGGNQIQFVYHGPQQMYSFACEFVWNRSMTDLRKVLMMKKAAQEAAAIATQQRNTYVQMAGKRQAGVVPVSLNCAISKKRMFCPARHNDCKKFVFDLAQLMNANKQKTRFYCQPCNTYFKFDDINIDYFIINPSVNLPLGINEIIIDKTGGIRPGDPEEVKPKRGKKKNDSQDVGGAHTIKRIKSEIIVKQEPGYPDMNGKNIPYSPMPMPGSVPDWSRLQSPSFAMQSPNKVQLGPATPATPGVVFQNPASAGSMLNMSSPRQTMMPGMNHPMMPPHDPSMAMRSGSAPYTPESVKNDKNDELLMHIEGLFITNQQNIIDVTQLVHKYIDGTKETNFEDQLVYECPGSPKQQQLDGAQTLLAPGSTSSSNASTFTPPFDDIHLGNRPSH